MFGGKFAWQEIVDLSGLRLGFGGIVGEGEIVGGIRADPVDDYGSARGSEGRLIGGDHGLGTEEIGWSGGNRC